ncbi:hypothetical protein THAOC_25447 [Thalassiosira oceanica]|uniref:Uncharacterized protein n=1 Tax=Thalassiosira oceanica TaxID=159749 RepID=K0S1D8_THAOC|nr:hypothetical protein THAOC_25447 [Thalassiosira oceanica]|eukprot:EJK54886.1 hypothetical protein THAOC_25447 [Thalassiosira oceanica]
MTGRSALPVPCIYMIVRCNDCEIVGLTEKVPVCEPKRTEATERPLQQPRQQQPEVHHGTQKQHSIHLVDVVGVKMNQNASAAETKKKGVLQPRQNVNAVKDIPAPIRHDDNQEYVQYFGVNARLEAMPDWDRSPPEDLDKMHEMERDWWLQYEFENGELEEDWSLLEREHVEEEEKEQYIPDEEEEAFDELVNYCSNQDELTIASEKTA